VESELQAREFPTQRTKNSFPIPLPSSSFSPSVLLLLPLTQDDFILLLWSLAKENLVSWMAMFISILSSIAFHLLICPSFSLFIHQSIFTYINLSLHPLSIYLYIHTYIHTNIHTSLPPSISHPSPHLSVHPPTYPFIIYTCLPAVSSDVSIPDIIPIAELTAVSILVTTKYSPSDTTTTPSLPKSTAVVPSPDPDVTVKNGTDPTRYNFLAPGLDTLHFIILVLRGCGNEDVGWAEQDQI